MPSIRVKGLDRSIEVESGSDLRRACIDNNVNLFFGPWAKVLNCRGKGFCNLCKVEVLEGADQLTPRTKREEKRLKNKPDTWRLACCTKVQGDIEIDSFPVRHAADQVAAEAIERATMEEEARKELEREDWLALQEDKPVKEKAPKKGLLAKIRKKKGIDDSDERAEGAPLEEGEEGAEPEGKGKGGLFGKGKKKSAKDADGNGKIKVKKGKKEKKGKKGEAEGAGDNDPDAAQTNGDAKKKPAGKKFGVKARKK